MTSSLASTFPKSRLEVRRVRSGTETRGIEPDGWVKVRASCSIRIGESVVSESRTVNVAGSRQTRSPKADPEFPRNHAIIGIAVSIPTTVWRIESGVSPGNAVTRNSPTRPVEIRQADRSIDSRGKWSTLGDLCENWSGRREKKDQGQKQKEASHGKTSEISGQRDRLRRELRRMFTGPHMLDPKNITPRLLLSRSGGPFVGKEASDDGRPSVVLSQRRKTPRKPPNGRKPPPPP